MLLYWRKRIIIVAIILATLIGGAYMVAHNRSLTPAQPEVQQPIVAPEVKTSGPLREVIGTSVLGRAIEAYSYGKGDTHLLFVGGMHGGYEWNSVLLAYTVMDYLSANPDSIPNNVTVTVIPSANPDGVFQVIGTEGRFALQDAPKVTDVSGLGRVNAHEVDLNRNFDCKWKSESMWRGKTESAGSAAFSEPESKALKSFVEKTTPKAVLFWHSQSNAVYASECTAGILPETLELMNTYATAAGYAAVKKFDAYEVTGDAEGWLASINIPAITVELQTHETVEWERNLAGIKAVFAQYDQKTEVSR